jgi:hypothetical protein
MFEPTATVLNLVPQHVTASDDANLIPIFDGETKRRLR